jgi:plastocyanin
MMKFMSVGCQMVSPLIKKCLILILALNIGIGLLGYCFSYTDSSVNATSSVTIETRDDSESDDDEDESQNSSPDEGDQSADEAEIEQEQQSIQPTGVERTEQNIEADSPENSYEVVIPDSAAWKESLTERFQPSEISVPVGSQVKWVNDDDTTHAIASGKQLGHDGVYNPVQDGVFYSGSLDEGDSFSFQFNEPGRYDYFCIPHPWMTGAVVVQ